MGPSSSAAPLPATEDHRFVDVIGVVPLSETAFTAYAFGIAALVFVTVVPTLYFLAPDEENAVGIEEYAPGLLDEEGVDTLDDPAIPNPSRPAEPRK